VLQDVFEKNIGVQGWVNFLKIKTTPCLQNPGYFPDALLPVFQMMNDAVIKNRIKTFIAIRQVLGVTGHKLQLLQSPRGLFAPGQSQHFWVDIKGVNPGRRKRGTDNPGPNSTAAADFKAGGGGWQIMSLFEEPGLPLLNVAPHRTVHPYALGPVDFHLIPFTP
jgi:hypothetical protein